MPAQIDAARSALAQTEVILKKLAQAPRAKQNKTNLEKPRKFADALVKRIENFAGRVLPDSADTLVEQLEGHAKVVHALSNVIEHLIDFKNEGDPEMTFPAVTSVFDSINKCSNGYALALWGDGHFIPACFRYDIVKIKLLCYACSGEYDRVWPLIRSSEFLELQPEEGKSIEDAQLDLLASLLEQCAIKEKDPSALRACVQNLCMPAVPSTASSSTALGRYLKAQASDDSDDMPLAAALVPEAERRSREALSATTPTSVRVGFARVVRLVFPDRFSLADVRDAVADYQLKHKAHKFIKALAHNNSFFREAATAASAFVQRAGEIEAVVSESKPAIVKYQQVRSSLVACTQKLREMEQVETPKGLRVNIAPFFCRCHKPSE